MSCSAVGCTNRYTKGSTLQLFRFPLRDANRLRQWLRNVRRINWTPSESSRLCSVHFEENDFCTNKEGHRRLKDTAVPTIFNFPQSFSKRLSSRKLSWSSLYGIMGVGDSSLCPPLLLGTYCNNDSEDCGGIPSDDHNAAMPLKKMVSCDLQLDNQDEITHAKDPEPLQTKEEREEFSISQDGEHRALKQEADTSLSSTSEESDQKPLCHDSHANESQDQNGQSGETGTNAEGESTESPHISESNSCNIAHSSNFLVFHTYALPGIKSFECQTCGKDFRSECKLNEHMIIHTDVKPYCCDTCGKRFRCSTTLNMHIRLHTGERPYSCKTCGMCFRRSHTLMVHMRMHTGEKPYLCKTCGKDFPFSSALKVHMRIHTGEKPYLCDICGKGFCQKTELIGHTRVHTGERPYSCKTCGLNFKRSNSLKVHMRRHTGDKPYNCETCGKKFRVKGCLTIHTRKAHTGEKPYCCKICGERFFESYHLAKHIRCHTDC